MSNNENSTPDNDFHVEEAFRSDYAGSEANTTPHATEELVAPTSAGKPRTFFTLGRMLAALALLIALALSVVVAATVDVPSIATKNSNESILKGIKGTETPVEIVDVVYAGNTSYTPIDKVIVRFEEGGQLTPCDVTVAKEGDSPKTFVECSGAVLILDEPKGSEEK